MDACDDISEVSTKSIEEHDYFINEIFSVIENKLSDDPKTNLLIKLKFNPFIIYDNLNPNIVKQFIDATQFLIDNDTCFKENKQIYYSIQILLNRFTKSVEENNIIIENILEFLDKLNYVELLQTSNITVFEYVYSYLKTKLNDDYQPSPEHNSLLANLCNKINALIIYSDNISRKNELIHDIKSLTSYLLVYKNQYYNGIYNAYYVFLTFVFLYFLFHMCF